MVSAPPIMPATLADTVRATAPQMVLAEAHAVLLLPVASVDDLCSGCLDTPFRASAAARVPVHPPQPCPPSSRSGLHGPRTAGESGFAGYAIGVPGDRSQRSARPCRPVRCSMPSPMLDKLYSRDPVALTTVTSSSGSLPLGSCAAGMPRPGVTRSRVFTWPDTNYPNGRSGSTTVSTVHGRSDNPRCARN